MSVFISHDCVDNDQRTEKCNVYRSTIEKTLGEVEGGPRRKRRKRKHQSRQGVLKPVIEQPPVEAAVQAPSMADHPPQSEPVAPDHLVGLGVEHQHQFPHASLFNNVAFPPQQLGEPTVRWDLLDQPWQEPFHDILIPHEMSQSQLQPNGS